MKKNKYLSRVNDSKLDINSPGIGLGWQLAQSNVHKTRLDTIRIISQLLRARTRRERLQS